MIWKVLAGSGMAEMGEGARQVRKPSQPLGHLPGGERGHRGTAQEGGQLLSTGAQ